MYLDDYNKKSSSPMIIVIVAFIFFLIICAFLNINLLDVDKTNYLKTPQAYDAYILRRHFLFIYIDALLLIMSLSTFINGKTHNFNELKEITKYSYIIFGIFTIIKIIHILTLPSKAPIGVWIIMPPFLYNILKGLGEIHIFYFFILTGICIFLFGFISKLLIKFLDFNFYLLASIIILSTGTYFFIKFCFYCEELFSAFA